MAIQRVKIRAKIDIGGLSVETPLIQSFNVRKQRGQVSTFDAALKVQHDRLTSGVTGGSVQIWAGENGPNDLIFTGICRSAKISPCYDDPSYVILSVGGADAMSLLQGKKYTRRCRATRTCWVAITGVSREGLKSGKFAFNNDPTIEVGPGLQQKEDALTAYTGTSVTEGNSPSGPSQSDKNNPPQPEVKVKNSATPEEEA